MDWLQQLVIWVWRWWQPAARVTARQWTRVRRPSALQLQVTDSQLATSTLLPLGADIISVSSSHSDDDMSDSMLLRWNQELFIQLCNRGLQASAGVLGVRAVHGETVLVLEDDDDVFSTE
jgi:hypothetical protein